MSYHRALAVPPRVVGGRWDALEGQMRFCLLLGLLPKVGPAAGDEALEMSVIVGDMLWLKEVLLHKSSSNSIK